MSATPLSVVKERFESKEKLLAAVEKLATKDLWLSRVNDVKGLKRASNKKLIHLHDLLEDAKKRFGNRDKLVQAIAELAQRPKDKDWVASLAGYPLPQLLDMHRSLDRAARRRAAAGETTEKKPKKEKKPMVKKPSKNAAAAKAEAPKAEAKPEPKKVEPKAEPKKAEPKKAEAKTSEAKSKPSASKPAASKAPATKKAPAAKKAPSKKE